MSPSFHPRHIASYAQSIVRYSEQIQQTWADGALINVDQEMTSLTMSIIGKALFDADVFTATDELGAAMETALEYVSHTISVPLPSPYGWPLPRNRRTRQAVHTLHQHLQAFIEERRKGSGERSDFLTILLQATDEDGRPMSDEQLMAECLTIFGAGHDTAASALTWTWYLLSQHPEVYQQVQQEVESVLEGRTPAYEDLTRLPYCLQVFKEAMRLYPPGYIIFRRALRDVEIDGYRVAKNQLVLLAPYSLHRREDYFPEPERFDPTRFAPEREKLIPRYAYLPFSAGPRICIAMHFALMEGQLALATLAQRVTFSLAVGQAVEADPLHHLSLRPAGALKMLVKRR